MPLEVGQEAPDFELPLKPGEAPLRLGDYKGEKPVVILFFPLAFSPVCTREVIEVANGYQGWKDLEVEVLGISVDSPFVTRKFAKECGAHFPILSDFNRTVTREYGVLCPDYYGLENVAHRAAFVVDRDGTIVYSWMTEDSSVMPDFEEVRKAIRNAAAQVS